MQLKKAGTHWLRLCCRDFAIMCVCLLLVIWPCMHRPHARPTCTLTCIAHVHSPYDFHMYSPHAQPTCTAHMHIPYDFHMYSPHAHLHAQPTCISHMTLTCTAHLQTHMHSPHAQPISMGTGTIHNTCPITALTHPHNKSTVTAPLQMQCHNILVLCGDEGINQRGKKGKAYLSGCDCM